jgi:hypothetical protein
MNQLELFQIENKQKILDYLKLHGKMTIRQGFALGINNVAEYVSRLRKQGYDIRTEWLNGITGKRYGIYIYTEKT